MYELLATKFFLNTLQTASLTAFEKSCVSTIEVSSPLTLYVINVQCLYLLTIFAKNEKIDLSQAERNELKCVLSDLANAYVKIR